MTVDEALFEMELVGHDFYLFNDKESRPARPSSTGATPTTTA